MLDIVACDEDGQCNTALEARLLPSFHSQD